MGEKKMSEIILILGGVRSGKSDFAQSLAEGESEVVFLATAKASDPEMRARIESHKQSRPESWRTIEADLDPGQALMGREAKAVILDCLTVLVANIMEEASLAKKDSAKLIEGRLESIIKAADESGLRLIVVSNEVGSGIVPVAGVAREYRDHLGKANQRFAAQAKEVYLMVAGIPVKIKG